MSLSNSDNETNKEQKIHFSKRDSRLSKQQEPLHDQHNESHIEDYPDRPNKKRPTNPRQNTSASTFSTDDEYHDDKILIDDGLPANIPLEALAGPALVLPTSDLDGHTLTDEFDWDGKEDDEEEKELKDEESIKKKAGAFSRSNLFICVGENSSYIAWTCIVLLGLIFIAIDVAIFVSYRNRVSITSFNLELWFTWLAFMWCIGFISQLFVELVPWLVKKIVSFIKPESIEVFRMKLSYYKALRLFIKIWVVSAWNWGSWAFIKDHLPLPVLGQDEFGMNIYVSKPSYVGTFYNIWESIFFASLFLFIEKFILQLIVTSFHKKAYGDRIKENDRALRILDKLKHTKKKNNSPQDFLKRIRRRNFKPTSSGTNTAVPSRSHSFEDLNNSVYSFNKPIHTPSPPPAPGKSIMSKNHDFTESKTNVRFPTQNMDTLIPIPPIEDRHPKDEKDNGDQHETLNIVDDSTGSADEKPKHTIVSRFKNRVKYRSKPAAQEEKKPIERPQAISRENTWMSYKSSDERSLFGSSTGKIFKGGYNRFLLQNSSRSNYNFTQSTTKQAKHLARRIFSNLVGVSQRDFAVEADFYPFFKSAAEATYAFGLFDTDGNGDLTKRELRAGCIKIYRERKNLTRSMRDLSQATGKLDIILMIIFTLIWVIIVCAAFGVNVGTDLMPLWSAFVAASFIFGTSAKDAFEAIIFVFVTHPFDSGDRVLIGEENWIVENVGLLVTTFIKWDGTIVYVKNSVLTTQYIINVRRSGRTGESIDIQVDFNTPTWKIKKITNHMIDWSNQYPKLYTPNSSSTNILSFQRQNMLTLSFYFEHTQNWQDSGGRWLRHNNYMTELKEECERLGITYSLPVQPYTKNDAPPETYNMGGKSSYGLEGMITKRRSYEHDEDGYTNRPIGAESGGHSTHHGGDNVDSGAVAGAAAAMMFSM